MIFSKKVNRLEYITRMGFDNTVDEKNQLMDYFSQLDRAYLENDQLATLRAERDNLAAANAELREALEITRGQLIALSNELYGETTKAPSSVQLAFNLSGRALNK